MTALNFCIGQDGRVLENPAERWAVFTVYSGITNASPARYIDLPELVKMAASPTTGPKNIAQALTPYRATAKTAEAAKVSEYHALVLDHDRDNLTPDQVRQVYRDYNLPVLLYTTASHTPDAQRWKAVVPFMFPIKFEQFTELSIGAACLLGTDPAQSRAQQVFYAPNKLTHDAGYHWFDDTEGRTLDPLNEAHPFIAACADSYLVYAEDKEKVAQQAASKPGKPPIFLTLDSVKLTQSRCV